MRLKICGVGTVFLEMQELPHWIRHEVHQLQVPVSDSGQYQMIERKGEKPVVGHYLLYVCTEQWLGTLGAMFIQIIFKVYTACTLYPTWVHYSTGAISIERKSQEVCILLLSLKQNRARGCGLDRE